MRLATHCRDTWVRRLWAPARMWPPQGSIFLMDSYPCPLEGGPTLLPCARRPPRAARKSVPLAAPQRTRPPGADNGTRDVLCLEHGAPSCPRCRILGWGINRCCRARQEGHAGPEVGPRGPDGRASGRTGPPSASASGPGRWGGGNILLPGRAWPASQALPVSGPSASGLSHLACQAPILICVGTFQPSCAASTGIRPCMPAPHPNLCGCLPTIICCQQGYHTLHASPPSRFLFANSKHLPLPTELANLACNIVGT